MADQLELTDRIIATAGEIQGRGVSLLDNIREKVMSKLVFLPYSIETEEAEHALRYRRSADQVLSDGYVYTGKACSDIVITYLSLAKAKGLQTRFVKLYNARTTHSIAEVRIPEGWYMHDVALNKRPVAGEFQDGIDGWKLYRKGRDAWDIGLTDYTTSKRLLINIMCYVARNPQSA
jgi:transglutaminase-like putative cysteine protease